MENNSHFVEALDAYLEPGAYISAGIAILIFLYHEFRILMIRDYKEKYDYVNMYEIRFFYYAVMAVILAVALYINSFASHFTTIFKNMNTWFWVRSFMTMCFVALGYVISYSMIRIYYPSYVERRLNKLRNKPRKSPEGNLMRKLAEAEEEAHLDSASWKEQKEVHSVDYDVWLDEKTGYKKIEKYISYHHAIECPECGYVTMRIKREEIVDQPSNDATGLLVKHYQCTYCKHREAHEVVLAPLGEELVS